MIANNLTSIYNAVDDMFDALVEKGVTVSDRKMNLIPQLVASIKQVAYPSVIPTNNLPTISDKTTAMLQIKAQIKSVIESSGVTATNNLSLFGNYIRSINTGSVLELQGPSTFTGKNYLITATFNGQQVNPSTWSVTAGSQYATVNQYGRVDITSGTISQSITVTAQYVDSGNTYTNTLTTTVTYDNQLTIQCSDTITGTSGNCVAVYNEIVVTPTWSITSGGSHATINSTGDITITSSGNITVQAVYSGYTTTKNITLVYEANTTTDTTVNEDGSTTTTTTTTTTDPQTGATTTESNSTTTNEDGSQSHTTSETTTNQDGSSTSSSTTTNSDGTSSENTTSVASDGSSSSTTTNYDANGDPTSGSNNTTDTSGNSNTQEITYDGSGNPEVTGYTIDTTNNPSGNGEEITTGLDTGVIVFDGNDWEASLTFKVHDYLTISNNPFFSAMYKENNKANGIVVYGFRSYGGTHYNESDTVISSSTSTNPVMRMKVNEWNNGSIQSDSYEFYSKHTKAYSSYRFGTRTNPLTLTLKATCNGNTLTVELYYNNQITAKPRYSKTYTFNSASDKDVTFKLGEMTNNSTTVYAQNFEVLDFVVRKL